MFLIREGRSLEYCGCSLACGSGLLTSWSIILRYKVQIVMTHLLDLDLGLVYVLFGPKYLIFVSLECSRGLDCPFKHNSESRIIKMQSWVFIIFHVRFLEPYS